MAPRKPLTEGCTGGIFCEVDGHLVSRQSGRTRTFSHVRLTLGQHKTLRERRKAADAARAAGDRPTKR